MATRIGFVNCSAAGNNELVAAPGAGRQIVLIHFFASASGGAQAACNIRSANNNKTPNFALASGEKITVYGTPDTPLVECNGNEALNWNNASATTVGVLFAYFIRGV